MARPDDRERRDPAPAPVRVRAEAPSIAGPAVPPPAPSPVAVTAPAPATPVTVDAPPAAAAPLPPVMHVQATPESVTAETERLSPDGPPESPRPASPELEVRSFAGKSFPIHGRRALAKKAAQAARTDVPASRATPASQTRLWMSLGEEMGIQPGDIVNTIAGETGLPTKVVGAVDIRARHMFVDVASEHVHGIIAKLNRAQIKGHKVKVKVA